MGVAPSRAPEPLLASWPVPCLFWQIKPKGPLGPESGKSYVDAELDAGLRGMRRHLIRGDGSARVSERAAGTGPPRGQCPPPRRDPAPTGGPAPSPGHSSWSGLRRRGARWVAGSGVPGVRGSWGPSGPGCGGPSAAPPGGAGELGRHCGRVLGPEKGAAGRRGPCPSAV